MKDKLTMHTLEANSTHTHTHTQYYLTIPVLAVS